MKIWILLQVRIFGGPAIYVKEGSSVQLECVVSQAVNTPKYIVWEHNGQEQHNNNTMIKKNIKFSSYVRKFKMEQLQSHIWLTASSYLGKYLRISSYIRKPFLIYGFATAPLWISLYMRKILFYFSSVQQQQQLRLVTS